MAQPQSAIQNTPVTSYITVSSLDRYSNGVPPPAGSNQTTCADITYSLPGLSNIATLQLNSINLSTVSWWSQVNSNAISAPFYTNLINLVDLTTSTTYLITIPETAQSVSTLIGNLGKYVQASTFGGSAVGGGVPLTIAASTATNSIYDPISAPAGLWWVWYDSGRSAATSHSYGWSRVTTAPDGTNIANRRQLFDILGLAGHVPSVAGLGSNGAGYTTIGYTPTAGNVIGPIRYIEFISPQLTNFAPDVNTNSNASSNPFVRLTNSIGLSGNQLPLAGLAGKVLKVAPGSTSLRIQLVDDQNNLIPTNFPVPVPYQGNPTAGTGILSTTLSNLTFSGISNANVTFPAGTTVNILTVSGSATGWTPGVYQVQSSTSNTVVIPYLTTSASQISNASYTFTMQPVWQTSLTGNQNGPEYQLTFCAIARTTTA